MASIAPRAGQSPPTHRPPEAPEIACRASTHCAAVSKWPPVCRHGTILVENFFSHRLRLRSQTWRIMACSKNDARARKKSCCVAVEFAVSALYRIKRAYAIDVTAWRDTLMLTGVGKRQRDSPIEAGVVSCHTTQSKPGGESMQPYMAARNHSACDSQVGDYVERRLRLRNQPDFATTKIKGIAQMQGDRLHLTPLHWMITTAFRPRRGALYR